MASKEQDILRDAMIDTEKEIYASAFGEEPTALDESGDRSPETMGEGLEGQHEPDEEEPEESEEGEGEPEKVEGKTETKAETKPEPKVEDEPRLVPSSRLRDEGRRAKAAEDERDALKARLDAAEAESAKKIDALRAEFRDALRQQPRPVDQPKPVDPAKPAGPPDLFEDPQGFAKYFQDQTKAEIAAVQQQAREDRINFSMELAKSKHGDTFDKAFAALRELPVTPDNRAVVQRLTSSPNPGQAVVDWHRRNETLREVGDDPAAYKAKIAEDTRKALMADPEFRKALVADLHAEAMTGDDGRPRTAIRLPPSLNRVAGGNARAPNDLSVFDGSDQAIFTSAFKD